MNGKCKECDGDGWYVDNDNWGDAVQVQCQDCWGTGELQECGHPYSAIVTNGTTSYCGQCADDSLRANIAAGVEA